MSINLARKSGVFATRRFASSFSNVQELLKDRGDISTLSELKNGFRVASYNNGRPTATVGVWINSGSQFETIANNGVASFFEHLIYSGSKKRTAAQLQSELSKIGAQLSSFTTREHTAYFAQCLTGDVEKVVEIIADVMRNTKLDDAKVEEFRPVLLKKLEESEGNPRQVVFDFMHQSAYQGTTMALSTLGNVNSLSNISSQDIAEFVDDCYKPHRMVLTGVGGVDHELLARLGEKHFGDLDNSYKRKIWQKDYVRFTGSELQYRDDNYPVFYGSVAIEGLPRDHVDYYALKTIATVVGQWDKTHATSFNAPSRLVQKICASPELHSFESFYLPYDNTGLFGYYFVANGNDIEDCTQIATAIQREWKHLATAATDDEVDRAKNQLKTNLFLAMEDNANIANHISAEVLGSGTITPLENIERKIHYLNAKSIREVVSNHIYDRDIVSAAIGRTEAFPAYHMLRFAMSWWRL